MPIDRNRLQRAQDPATLADVRTEFLDFYTYERPLVERFLMVLGASRQDAEDGAQGAFEQAWRLVAREEWDRVENRRAWVRKVAYRCFIRPPGQRRSALAVPMAPSDLPDPAQSAPDHAELTAQTLSVLDALARLGDGQAAAVIALVELDDFTTAQAANILDVSEQRIRDLRKKARDHLRKHLVATASTGGPKGGAR